MFEFPYTNFHELNADWLIKTVKILFNRSVFSVNNKLPDDAGNVDINAADVNAVATVNGEQPDSAGNVSLDALDVGAVASVNGEQPDSAGNVSLDALDVGAVATINSISPDSAGDVSLDALDVGAVASVNGEQPDSAGNVNVGTVKSVNSTLPDSDGNVNLPTVAGVTSVCNVGPDGDGNVDLDATDVGAVATINSISPDSAGDVSLDATDVGAIATVNSLSPDVDGNVAIKAQGSFTAVSGTMDPSKATGSVAGYMINNVCALHLDITLTAAASYGTVLAADIPNIYGGNYAFMVQDYTGGGFTTLTILPTGVWGYGNLVANTSITNGHRLLGTIVYLADRSTNISIVSQ